MILWLAVVAAGAVAAGVFLYLVVLRPTKQRMVKLAARLAALYENNADMIAFYSRSGNVTHANRAAREWFHDDPQLVGRTFEQHVLPSERATSALHFTRALAGASASFETVFVRADGTELPVMATLQPVVVGGAVTGVYGIAKDASRVRSAQDELQRSEQRFRSIFEHTHDAAFAIDRRGCFVAINEAATTLTGYGERELIGKSAERIVPADLLELARDVTRSTLRGQTGEHDATMVRKDGSSIDVRVHMLPIRERGEVTGAFAFVKDVSAQRALERQLAERDDRMRSLYVIASSPDGDAKTQIDEALALGSRALHMQAAYLTRIAGDTVTIYDRFGDGDELPIGAAIRLARSAERRILGAQNAVGVHDLRAEPWAKDLVRARLDWKSFIATGISVDGATFGTLAFVGREPREKPFAQPDYDFIDLMSMVVASALARERRQAEVRELAFRDPLTGLANRALLEEHIERAIARARRTREQVAVHFVDLDRFKPINDAYGHAAGDEVLCEIAKRLSDAVREQDVVARVGGDEFVALQTGVVVDASIRAMARRLARAIREPILLSNGTVVRVAASHGIAAFPNDATDVRALLRYADTEMYRAKESAHDSLVALNVSKGASRPSP